MLYEPKVETREENAIRLLTFIAEEFQKNHEATIGFDKEFVLDVISFLEYNSNECKLMEALKNIDLDKYK